MLPTLLAGCQDLEVCRDPFPHVVVRRPIPPDTCEELIASFPGVDVVTQGRDPGSNKRFSYSAHQALLDPRVSPLWRELLARHTGDGFLRELAGLFREDLVRRYPELIRERGPVERWRAGIRRCSSFARADVMLDAQICVNTPVLGEETSVRGPHVDLPNKLFVGLFYLRSPQDRSRGGDLLLYRFKGGRPARFRGVYVGAEDLEVAKVIRYEANVLVLFLNSEWAVHGVTPRGRAELPRLFLNLVGEAPRPLFDLEPYQQAA